MTKFDKFFQWAWAGVWLLVLLGFVWVGVWSCRVVSNLPDKTVETLRLLQQDYRSCQESSAENMQMYAQCQTDLNDTNVKLKKCMYTLYHIAGAYKKQLGVEEVEDE